MRRYWKVSLILLIFVSSVVIFAVISSSQQHMMRGMMGNWDNMMNDCNRWMDDWHMMMGQRMTPACMGMMNMGGMGTMMYNMSWHMKGMMNYLNGVMSNEEMMKDEEVKKNVQAMQEHMKIMSEQMQGAMDNMNKIRERFQQMK